jgi:hypothetical protein
MEIKPTLIVRLFVFAHVLVRIFSPEERQSFDISCWSKNKSHYQKTLGG